MPSSCSNPTDSRSTRAFWAWCSFLVGWPCERVVAELKVATYSRPNVLEWAVIRILQEFKEEVPTIREATEELGIEDPVFLTQTVTQLLQDGALEIQDPQQGLDLPNCRITETGRLLLEGRHVMGAPQRYGVELCFDAVTGQHLPDAPRQDREKPHYLVVCEEELSERVTRLGLDRVRELARLQKEPFLTPDSLIREVSIQYEDGNHLWAPMQLSLAITRKGVLQANLHEARPDQQDWLDQRDLDIHAIEQIRKASARIFNGGLRLKPQSFADWVQKVQRLISPLGVATEAQKRIAAAKDEIAMDSAWLTVPHAYEGIVKAANRDIRCVVRGNAAWLEDDPLFHSGNVQVVGNGQSKPAFSVPLVVDGFRAMSVDQVLLQTPGGRELETAIASWIRSDYVNRVRQGLLSEGLAAP